MLFSRASSPQIDQSWNKLYRVAGIAMMLVGILYFMGAVFSAVIGPPPSDASAYLDSLRSQVVISRLNFHPL